MHWGEHQENEALMFTNETTFVLLIKCIANMHGTEYLDYICHQANVYEIQFSSKELSRG